MSSIKYISEPADSFVTARKILFYGWVHYQPDSPLTTHYHPTLLPATIPRFGWQAHYSPLTIHDSQ